MDSEVDSDINRTDLDHFIGTYFDGNIKFVPDANNGNHYIDNCIAYKNAFTFGSEAKCSLGETYCSFDIKDILWKDWADDSELQKYPFKWVKKPLQVLIQSEKERGLSHKLFIQTLVALQVLNIKHAAEKLMKGSIRVALFTVRTDYRIRQRAILSDVSRIAGFERVHLITEITAATVAYVIDKNRDSLTKEIIMVFSLDHAHCDCSIIKVSNTSIEYISHDSETVDELLNVRSQESGILIAIIGDYINNQLSLKGLRKEDLSKILVIGHSDRLTEFKNHIIEHFSSKRILYDCNPKDIVAIGTAYFGQILENRLDIVVIEDIIKMGIKMYLHMNDGRPKQHELMGQNVSVQEYFKSKEIEIKVHKNNFPIAMTILEDINHQKKILNELDMNKGAAVVTSNMNGSVAKLPPLWRIILESAQKGTVIKSGCGD
ncbi:unnamed protein product [Oppiella nova]|uniref:Uncharacterized protein n=1 Tax=Oppiella nova TaxID=334625 RepID=A0A7R9L8L8_9ACAR|nr:unnamed protein product [Oppiella nova]CAG2159425.1 unnamed protein product [Oppiella nova]